MNVVMIRAKIKEENVADTQAATDKVIQALKQAQPDVHYGVTRLCLLYTSPSPRD